jgi:hypothetical protein
MRDPTATRPEPSACRRMPRVMLKRSRSPSKRAQSARSRRGAGRPRTARSLVSFAMRRASRCRPSSKCHAESSLHIPECRSYWNYLQHTRLPGFTRFPAMARDERRRQRTRRPTASRESRGSKQGACDPGARGGGVALAREARAPLQSIARELGLVRAHVLGAQGLDGRGAGSSTPTPSDIRSRRSAHAARHWPGKPFNGLGSRRSIG